MVTQISDQLLIILHIRSCTGGTLIPIGGVVFPVLPWLQIFCNRMVRVKACHKVSRRKGDEEPIGCILCLPVRINFVVGRQERCRSGRTNLVLGQSGFRQLLYKWGNERGGCLVRHQHPGLVVAISGYLAIGNTGKRTPSRKPWHDIVSPWQTDPTAFCLFCQCWPVLFYLSPFGSNPTNFCPSCFSVYPSIGHDPAMRTHL